MKTWWCVVSNRDTHNSNVTLAFLDCLSQAKFVQFSLPDRPLQTSQPRTRSADCLIPDMTEELPSVMLCCRGFDASQVTISIIWFLNKGEILLHSVMLLCRHRLCCVSLKNRFIQGRLDVNACPNYNWVIISATQNPGKNVQSLYNLPFWSLPRYLLWI